MYVHLLFFHLFLQVKTSTNVIPMNSPLHVLPSPVKPSAHAQVKEPAVLVQIAFPSQSSVLDVHSSISVTSSLLERYLKSESNINKNTSVAKMLFTDAMIHVEVTKNGYIQNDK